MSVSFFSFSARGGDLFARIDGDSLPEFEAVKILKQVLDALKFIHDLGFMHLDLKVRICTRPNRIMSLHGQVVSLRKQPSFRLRGPGAKMDGCFCSRLTGCDSLFPLKGRSRVGNYLLTRYLGRPPLHVDLRSYPRPPFVSYQFCQLSFVSDEGSLISLANFECMHSFQASVERCPMPEENNLLGLSLFCSLIFH